jgi:AbrB family looped-hinge helix DNA binding protein
MATMLTSKGQVTIPKHIRDALDLTPGSAVEFTVNRDGEVVVRRAGHATRARRTRDRFDAVRGRANVPWRTDGLMRLLRGER